MNDQSTDLATRDAPTPLRRLRADLSDPSSLEQFKAALPENVPVSKFQRALLTAVNEKPELVDVYQQNAGSLFSALTKCAAAGLLPDGKQAAINVYTTKVKRDGKDVWLPTAQFLPMVAGLRHILAGHGWMLRTRVVYANDEFAWTEEPPTLLHRPAHAADRGDRVYAWAIADHRDGRRVQRVIDAAEVAKRKAKAKTQKIWDEWTDAMWEKSAGHAIFDDIPLGELESDRIRRLLDETGLLEPTAATKALYGPTESAAPVPPPPGGGTDTTPNEAPADESSQPHLGQAEAQAGTGGDDEDPQAASTPFPPDGGDAGGSGPDDVDWEALSRDQEPEPEQQQQPDPGDVEIPGGDHAGRKISMVARTKAGRAFLMSVLKTVREEDLTRKAIAAYAEQALPDLWREYTDWQSRRTA